MPRARLRVAFPNTGNPASLTWAPPPGMFIDLAGANTMRDAGGPDTNGAQPLETVISDWNGGIYARDAGPFGMIVNAGSGHGNLHDAVYGQSLAALPGDCRWDQIFPLSPLSAFSENNTAGSIPTGGIPPGVNSSPTPPHNYDDFQYIPAALFGNTKGAMVYLALDAVGNSAAQRVWTWFGDLDTNPITWSLSTNSIPPDAEYAQITTGGSAVFDPVRGCFWRVEPGFLTNVAKLDIATRTWFSVPFGSNLYNTGGDMMGGYCPSLDCVVWYYSGDINNLTLIVWKPNAAGTAGTLIFGAPMSGIIPTAPVGFEWCPHPNVQRFYGAEYRFNWVSVSQSSPAIVTWNDHHLVEGNALLLDGTGGNPLPSPLQESPTKYYVRNPTTNTFQVAATPGGTPISTTTSQVGIIKATAAYPNPVLRTLTAPATINGTWVWGEETFAPQNGATMGNDSGNPRYNALRWVEPAKSFCWANRVNGPTNFFRPAGAI